MLHAVVSRTGGLEGSHTGPCCGQTGSTSCHQSGVSRVGVLDIDTKRLAVKLWDAGNTCDGRSDR